MFSDRSIARYLALGLGTALLVGAIFTGGVMAGQFGGFDNPETVASSMREGAVVRVADIGAAPRLSGRGVFVQVTSTGLLCLFDAPSASSLARQGGCNSVEEPLGGSKLSASLSYDGGPDATQVSDARLIGLVSLDVASVHVLMSDGTQHTIPMRREAAVATPAGSFRAFGYRFKGADFKRGVGPTAVLALDSSGAEIDRQATGFGG